MIGLKMSSRALRHRNDLAAAGFIQGRGITGEEAWNGQTIAGLENRVKAYKCGCMSEQMRQCPSYRAPAVNHTILQHIAKIDSPQ